MVETLAAALRLVEGVVYLVLALTLVSPVVCGLSWYLRVKSKVKEIRRDGV